MRLAGSEVADDVCVALDTKSGACAIGTTSPPNPLSTIRGEGELERTFKAMTVAGRSGLTHRLVRLECCEVR